MKKTRVVFAIGFGIAATFYIADKYWPALFAEALPKAEALRITKSSRRLELIAEGKIIKTYRVSLGRNPIGPKLEEGDSRTPEGNYTIEWRKPDSLFYRALRISYPNASDKVAAARANKRPGGDIMIHGVPNGLGIFSWAFAVKDWTNGCIAVDNISMAELWETVGVGTPVKIVP